MAEEEYDDYDDYAEWLYVEDDYPLADELAETQIPSPGYGGTSDELMNEFFADFDQHEYWLDIQYGDDEYWDSSLGGVGVPTAAQTRGRAMTTPTKTKNLKRKLSLKDTEGDNVRFVPLAARLKAASHRSPVQSRRHSFALLPDWREKFAETTGLTAKKAMPVEMKQAAETKIDDTPPKARSVDAVMAGEEGGDDEWEDEDEGEGEDGDVELDNLDPSENEEVLKSMLMERLRGTPMEGMDKDLLMQSMSQLLSGQGGGALDNLTNSLLGQATEGNDENLSGWLSQQGVSIDADDPEDEGEESSIAVAQPKKAARKGSKRNIEASPQDSAIGISKGGIAELALHNSSPSSGKRRTAPTNDDGSAKKRKKVAFVDTRFENGDSFTVASAPVDDEDSIQVASAPSQNDESIAVASNKVANKKAAKKNTSRSKTLREIGQAETAPEDEGGTVDDMEDNIDVKAKPDTVSKSSRKRKAADDEIEVDGSGPLQKRQTKRSVSASANNANEEVMGRKTRGARAQVGK